MTTKRVRGAAMRKGTAKKILRVEDLANGEKIDPDAVVLYSLRLPAAVYERLRKLAFDTRRPMTEFVIRGLEIVFKTEKH